MMAKAKDAPRADLITKDPSATHKALAQFITEQTGYEPDLKTLQLRSALYRSFIKSEEHATRLAGAKAEREQAEAEKDKRRQEREAKAKEKAAAPAKKAAAKKAAPAKKAAAKKTAAAPAKADEPF